MHDVLIIGGGVIGLSIAYEAAGCGLSVVLFEQGPLGSEASWAGAGIVPAGGDVNTGSPVHRLQSAANRLWPALSDDLRTKTGIDNGYVRCGGLTLFQTSQQQELDSHVQEWRRTGIEFEILDAEGLNRCEPQVTVGREMLVAHVPGVCQLRNPRHLRALINACAQRGVELRSGEPVTEIRQSGGRVEGITTATGRYSAGQYVVSSGAWSGPLLAQCGFSAEIVPVRGQIVLLSTAMLPFRRIVEQGPRYLVPRPDGRILIGSTEEWVGFNKATTSAGVGALLAFGTGLVPSLSDARFERAWSGLRPHAKRGMPFVGRLPGHDDVLVATGHFRGGLSLSPITARLVGRLPGHDNVLVATGHFRGGLSLSPITARLVGQLLTGTKTDLPLDELGLSPGA